MSKQPNILLIMTDQHRADHVGFGGNDIVKTPNLDELAQRGTVFDKAYVANPICMPNRASIMTGVVPSSHGVRYNGISLDPSLDTFVRIAKRAGYCSSLIGKSHLQNFNEDSHLLVNLLKDEPIRPIWREPASRSWNQYEDQEQHRVEDVKLPRDYYGFQNVDLVVNHSDYCSGHYYRWLVEMGIDPKLIQGQENALKYDNNWQQLWRTAVPEELYPTRYIADRTVERIRDAAKSNKQFLIQCSFPDPHHPFTPPGRYFDMYDPASIPIPETFYQDHSKSPPSFQAMIEHRGHQGFKMAPFSPSETQFQDMAAKQYGMISMIDDAVGDIVSSLKQLGILEDTIILFTSDHGDAFGDHGLMFKSTIHYEGNIRVPFFISGPGIPNQRTSSLVSSLDIGPTLLDLIGLEPSFGSQGKSLCPILSDRNIELRDAVLIEEERLIPDLTTGEEINMRTVVTQSGRLTLWNNNPLSGELYVYDEDPAEVENRFDDPGYADFKQELLEILIASMLGHSTSLRRPSSFA